MIKTNLCKVIKYSVTLFIVTIACSMVMAQKKKRIFTAKEGTEGFITEKFNKEPIDSFILKFTEGTKIRLRGNRFVTLNNAIKDKDILLLKESELNVDSLQMELQKVNMVFRGFQNMIVKRYFDRPEQEIDQEQDTLESKINEELSDLNLYYLITLRSGDAKELISFLNYFKIVENAYPVYKIDNAIFINKINNSNNELLKTYEEISDLQEYLNPAPKGIDAKYAWTINGGKGEGVRIIDVESFWDLNHEDLKTPFWFSSSSVNSKGDSMGDHGTAVLGEMLAKHNLFGIKGICPDAGYGVSGVSTLAVHSRGVSAAIDKAARLLKEGDIILIEQHTPGPKTGAIDSTCNPRQFEFVPMEYYQDCFDAIRRATAKGIIIVEAAGNGAVNLDAALYRGLFDRKVRDSKAIFVAADEGGNGVPACWTNYGSRIDFFGWGGRIVTTGYGGYPNIQNDWHKKYTNNFGGTSGASPIIVGAIACIQSIRKKAGLPVWSADLIRTNIIGTPQVPGVKFIAAMPNLRATLLKMGASK